MADKIKIGDIKKKKKGNLIDQAPGPRRTYKKRKKAGRPKKEKDEKLTEKAAVYLTKDEMKKLKKFSENNFGAPYTAIIRKVLKEAGVI